MSTIGPRALLVCLTLLMALASAAAVELAREDQALLPIVVADATSPSDAARDLALYLGRITGGSFELVSAADHGEGPAIYLGPEHFRPNEADATRSLRMLAQVAQVYTTERGLFITGGGEAGCGFAVYMFLVELCGVRFFHPGPLGEHVPQQPDLALQDVSLRQTPSFKFRRMWPSSQTPDRRMYRQWQQWARRSRQGGPPVAMGHNLSRIVPPELYDQHPDYFPLIGGVRLDPRSGAAWQPELANPGVVQLAVDKARAYFDSSPDAVSYSLSMNDCAGWSESPEALEQDPPQYRGLPDRGKARRMIVFANAVAEQVAQSHPDRYLAFYAYKSTLEPPAEPVCLPNVMPAICHWGIAADPFHPITAADQISPPNALYRRAIEGWDTLAGKLIAREYWCAPRYDPLLKAGVTPILFEDIPYYQTHGFVACSSEAEIDWGNLALNHYVASRLMWNVRLEPEKLLEDYFVKYYGDAARPMREYFTRIWEVAYRHHLPEPSRAELSEEDLDYLAGRLQRAAQDVADDELRSARVKLAADFLQVYRAWRGLSESEPTEADIEEFMALLDRLQAEDTDAVVVESWRARFVAPAPEPQPYQGPDLVRAMPGAELPDDARPLAFRRAGTWLVLAGGDRLIRGRVTGVRVGPQYAHRPSWVVADRSGEVVASGSAPVNGAAEMQVQVSEPGLYQVLANAGRNGCAFVCDNCPAVMVGPGMQLCEIEGRMYFQVPAACERFTVTLFAGRGESALMRIYDPEGRQAFAGDSLSRDLVPAQISPAQGQRGKAWAVEIAKAPAGVLEDYQILLSAELPPYLATSPEALLVAGGE